MPQGERVTVRHRLADGRATDSVGTLVSCDAAAVTLRTRRGEVRIPLASVVVHRRVRPVPWRVATFMHRAGVAVLEVESLLDSPSPGLAAPVHELVEALCGAAVPVVVLTAGAEGGADALERLRGADGHLLTAVDRGSPWPAAGSFAAVHAEVERRLGRPLAREEVRYADPRPAHVEAARALGWQARVLTPPSG